MWTVYKKELKSYFLSPIGYIAIGIFLIVFSVIFYLTTITVRQYDMGNLYYNTARFGLLLIIPIICRRKKKWNRATIINFTKKYYKYCNG